jgi:hypothetical protein
MSAMHPTAAFNNSVGPDVRERRRAHGGLFAALFALVVVAGAQTATQLCAQRPSEASQRRSVSRHAAFRIGIGLRTVPPTGHNCIFSRREHVPREHLHRVADNPNPARAVANGGNGRHSVPIPADSAFDPVRPRALGPVAPTTGLRSKGSVSTTNRAISGRSRDQQHRSRARKRLPGLN